MDIVTVGYFDTNKQNNMRSSPENRKLLFFIYCVKNGVNKKECVRVDNNIFVIHVFKYQTDILIEVIISSYIFKSIKCKNFFSHHINQSALQLL